MRIFLLPISTRQALVYNQRLPQAAGAKLSIADRITKKATETWAKWESSKSGWQRKVVEYGNRGLQRIPYQEWGLKSFPPSNPKIQADQLTAGTKFDVVFPSNIMDREDVPKVLARLASERKQLHYRRFVGSLVALPFMLPFALIPMVLYGLSSMVALARYVRVYITERRRNTESLPALKGSDHLDFILDHKLYRSVSNTSIEEIYSRVPDTPEYTFNFITRSQVEDGTAPVEQLLLKPGSHDLVASNLGVPELSTEVERAIWQIERNLAQAQAITEKQAASTSQGAPDTKTNGNDPKSQ